MGICLYFLPFCLSFVSLYLIPFLKSNFTLRNWLFVLAQFIVPLIFTMSDRFHNVTLFLRIGIKYLRGSNLYRNLRCKILCFVVQLLLITETTTLSTRRAGCALPTDEWKNLCTQNSHNRQAIVACCTTIGGYR